MQRTHKTSTFPDELNLFSDPVRANVACRLTHAYISFSLSRSVRARAFVVERVVCRLVLIHLLLTASTAVRDNVD